MSLASLRHAELVSASSPPPREWATSWTLKQVQGDGIPVEACIRDRRNGFLRTYVAAGSAG
jgi:hypothetical protein